MIRLVLDTNVLIAAARSPKSASRKIIQACLKGRATSVISNALQREYGLLLHRALRNISYTAQLTQLINLSERVEPASVPRVVPDDPDDDKLVALALAGNIDALITSDKHLKTLDMQQGIAILSPGAAVARFPQIAT